MSNYGKKKKKNGTLHFTAVQIDNHYIEVNSSFEDVFKQKKCDRERLWCGNGLGGRAGFGPNMCALCLAADPSIMTIFSFFVCQGQP